MIGVEVWIGCERASANIAPAMVVLPPDIQLLLAPRHAGLERERHGNGDLIAGVETKLPQALVILIVDIRQAVGRRPVIVRIEKVWPAILDERGKQIRMRAIEDPTGTREAHGERAGGA